MPRRPAPATPRPELLSLLRAAKEQAEDDLPRLVLADWLEEHGHPADVARAEFVRAQVELARLPTHDRRRQQLLSRTQALAREHREAWLGPLAPVVGEGAPR